MSGQFANKQFGGDQFAGKQFGANEGDSGIVWLSANLTGSGAVGAGASHVVAQAPSAGARKLKFYPAFGVEARLVPVAPGRSRVAALLPRTGVRIRLRGAAGVAHTAGASVRATATARTSGAVATTACGAVFPRATAVGRVRGVARGVATAALRPVAGSSAFAYSERSTASASGAMPRVVHNPTDEELAVLAVLAIRASRRRFDRQRVDV